MEQIPEANRGEMIDFIRGCRDRGFTGHTGNFATMTIEEVRAVFAAAWAWAQTHPETPPRATIRADLFAMDKRRQFHQ